MEASETVFSGSNLEAIYGMSSGSSHAHHDMGNLLPYWREPFAMPFTSGLPKQDHGYLRDIEKVKQEEYGLDGSVSDIYKRKRKEYRFGPCMRTGCQSEGCK